MYFNDFLTFLRNNDYINSELYDAILKWDRDGDFFYTNIKEGVKHIYPLTDLTCKIVKVCSWKDIYNFSLEIKYQIHPKVSDEFSRKYIVELFRNVLIIGKLEWNQIENIEEEEEYIDFKIRDRDEEWEAMSDFEKEMELKKYT